MSLNLPGFSLTPNQAKVALPSNYLTDFDFTDQYLPDFYQKEFARYGQRTLAGFLRNISAEIPSESDLIKWSEQGRLHTKYTGLTHGTYSAGTEVMTLGSGSCNFRVNQVVFMSGSAGASAKGVITAVTTTTFTVAFYANVGASPFAGGETVTAFVYGSEFEKGSNGMVGALTPEPDIHEVKPVIIKDKFEVSGSDMAQIGWIEVEGDGGLGYLWYLKAAGETRQRFDDYLEMMMVEHVEAEASSGAETFLGGGSAGSMGLFEAIETGGNVWAGGNPTSLADFDTVVDRLDKQGSIAENTIFCNRAFSLDIDDMLATQNSYGVGGTSYGMFNNDKDMAINLGFTGFRRGSYDFYKSDWKYLNDATTRGGLVGGAVNGVLVPSGSTSVYDMVKGERASRPFLHVRYRANERENRKYKSWVLGSAGGAQTSDLDAMELHFLSERALCTMGANNFVIFED
jgi:hypothetical protein